MKAFTNRAAKRGLRTLALAALCGAAFAAPVLANPSYTFKTIAATDPNLTPGVFVNLGLASINDAGTAAFYASTYCNATCSGVFTVDAAGTLTKLIDGGPAATLPYQTYGDAIINHGGAVSFSVANFTAAGAASSVWVDLWKVGVVRQVIPSYATNPPGLYPVINARLFNNSKVIYAETATHNLMIGVKGKLPQPAAPGYCTASNATGSSLSGWIVTAGGPAGATCVSTGYLATNLPTATTTLRIPDDGTYGQLGAATINASGTIAFVAKNQPGHTNVEALYQQKAGGGVQKLAELDNGACANAPPPSGTCQYLGYANALAINPKGQTLANVLISNWTSSIPNPSNSTGLVLNGDAQNGRIVWPGMVINGCTVHDATTGPRGINKYGQIVILLNCLPSFGPGRPNLALVVATPPVQ